MKITDHSISAGKFEIAGYLMGFAKEGFSYVLDDVELPIIGTIELKSPEKLVKKLLYI